MFYVWLTKQIFYYIFRCSLYNVQLKRNIVCFCFNRISYIYNLCRCLRLFTQQSLCFSKTVLTRFNGVVPRRQTSHLVCRHIYISCLISFLDEKNKAQNKFRLLSSPPLQLLHKWQLCFLTLNYFDIYFSIFALDLFTEFTDTKSCIKTFYFVLQAKSAL